MYSFTPGISWSYSQNPAGSEHDNQDVRVPIKASCEFSLFPVTSTNDLSLCHFDPQSPLPSNFVSNHNSAIEVPTWSQYTAFQPFFCCPPECDCLMGRPTTVIGAYHCKGANWRSVNDVTNNCSWTNGVPFTRQVNQEIADGFKHTDVVFQEQGSFKNLPFACVSNTSTSHRPTVQAVLPQYQQKGGYTPTNHSSYSSQRLTGAATVKKTKCFKEDQYKVLKQYFAEDQYLQERLVGEIVEKTSLTKNQIKRWFRNERYRFYSQKRKLEIADDVHV